MKKSHTVVLAVLIIGITTVGFIVALQPPSPDFSDLFWAIDLHDTFDYEIETSGTENWEMGLVDSKLGPINNTIIRVRVENLPSLDGLTSQSVFTTEIIQNIKLSGTFANGSELTYWATVNLLPAISSCILPNGSWSTIDSLFPDTIPSEYISSSKYYATKLYTSFFSFIYKWTGPYDDGGGWDGVVSITNGVPTEIDWNYYHAGTHSYAVHMTLVS